MALVNAHCGVVQTPLRYLWMLQLQAQLQQDYSVALQQQVTCSVTQGACSKCGLCLQDCRLVRHVEVIVIDIATCCTVQVPVVECSRCRMHAGRPYTPAAAASGVATADAVQQQQQQQQWGPFIVHPFAAGCFPATPVHGVRLHLSQQSRSPVWFTMRLLQHWYGALYATLGATLVLHSVLVDGLQKMRHFKNADSAAACEDDNSAAADPCNTFKADKVLGRSSDMFDQSGIITLLCRHGFLLAALNMATGERWAYATYLLHVLMREHGILPYVMMYDINCKYQAHFKNWVQQHSEWPQVLQNWALQQMAMPLPSGSHSMPTCTWQHAKAKNSLSRVPAGGTGIGEPTEQMNWFLGLAGVVLQYATLSARALWLEVLFRRWNVRKWRDLPRLLESSGYRAAARKTQLTEQQGDLAKQAAAVAKGVQLPINAEFLQMVTSWGCCPTFPETTVGHTALPWDAEIAELMVQLDSFTWHGSPLLPSALVQQVMGLSPTALADRQKRLERLQAAHPETALWTSESLELKQAVGRLCCAKVAAFKQVERKQRLHFGTRWAQRKIGDVSRREHQKLTREVLKLAGLLTTALQALLAWQRQRQPYKQHLCGDAAEQELRLVSFEMDSYGRSMCLEVNELATALRTQSAELSEASNKQEQLEGMLGSSSPRQQYQVYCAGQQAETAACAARARMLLLQQKLDATVHLQSVAAVAFQRYSSSIGSSAAVAMGAAAALVDEGRGSECGSESEDEGLYSDDGELGDAPAAAAAAAAPAATARPPPSAGPDRTVVGGGSASGVAASCLAADGSIAVQQHVAVAYQFIRMMLSMAVTATVMLM
ncbi:hypothetical protein COO60DRAFT_1624964 [Scenedesmus sp. NREL 46B-D3]|nr:hypothetical protein COO60DRAFT_1624964 [Scenedesmus sp. NREL 46B-D3]